MEVHDWQAKSLQQCCPTRECLMENLGEVKVQVEDGVARDLELVSLTDISRDYGLNADYLIG